MTLLPQLFVPVYFLQQGVWLVFIITIFIESPVHNANSVDLDQMLHSAASDVGLHCANFLLGGLGTKMGWASSFDDLLMCLKRALLNDKTAVQLLQFAQVVLFE